MVIKVVNKQFRLSYVIVVILIGVLVFGLGFTSSRKNVPTKVYQVYIDGEVIGTVRSDKSFDDYINAKEEFIKKKYGVNKVYMPKGVTIKGVTTYNSKVDSNEDVYQKLAS